jgi:DNA-directed RNA polymerase subunit beta'
VSGTVKFGDILPGKTVQEKVDPVTGKSSHTIIESKLAEARPRISIKDEDGQDGQAAQASGMARYILPTDAILLVEEGDAVQAGDIIAKLPGQPPRPRTSPAVCRESPNCLRCANPRIAVLSEIDGYVIHRQGDQEG